MFESIHLNVSGSLRLLVSQKERNKANKRKGNTLTQSTLSNVWQRASGEHILHISLLELLYDTDVALNVYFVFQAITFNHRVQ